MTMEAARFERRTWRNVDRRTEQTVADHAAVSAHGSANQQGIQPHMVAGRAFAQVAQRHIKQPYHARRPITISMAS